MYVPSGGQAMSKDGRDQFADVADISQTSMMPDSDVDKRDLCQRPARVSNGPSLMQQYAGVQGVNLATVRKAAATHMQSHDGWTSVLRLLNEPADACSAVPIQQ